MRPFTPRPAGRSPTGGTRRFPGPPARTVRQLPTYRAGAGRPVLPGGHVMSRKPLSLPPLSRLEAIDPDTGLVNVVIDTPRGSRCKYKFDEAGGFFRLKKL